MAKENRPGYQFLNKPVPEAPLSQVFLLSAPENVSLAEVSLILESQRKGRAVITLPFAFAVVDDSADIVFIVLGNGCEE